MGFVAKDGTALPNDWKCPYIRKEYKTTYSDYMYGEGYYREEYEVKPCNLQLMDFSKVDNFFVDKCSKCSVEYHYNTKKLILPS